MLCAVVVSQQTFGWAEHGDPGQTARTNLRVHMAERLGAAAHMLESGYLNSYHTLNSLDYSATKA